ncbi:hypothetical protein QTP86_009268 [Hemibagrus guttatus]|nr:hypothetical protein QTP86_009268 [Hemibagrus guttatus]
MLRFSLGVTRLDRIRNEYIRGTAHVGRLGDKVREARLRWFGHVQRREKSAKAVVTIKPDKHVFRGDTVTLRCEIQGGGDTEWTYSWYKNDYELYREHKTQEFSLRSVRNEDSGSYTCRGWRSSDTQSSEISDAVTLTVSGTLQL